MTKFRKSLLLVALALVLVVGVAFGAACKAKYELTYAAGEGTGDAPEVVKLSAGDTVTLKDADTFTAPAGKVFDGWSDGTTKYAAGDEFTMPANAVTLTAQWKAKSETPPEPEKYALTYAANGGTGNAPAAEQLTAGTEITLKANMFTAPAGKEFDGWMVDGVKKNAGDKVTMPAKALTITAQWKDVETPPEPAKYALTYVANGGLGSAPAAEQVAAGTEITLKANMFAAPTGKEFDGWMVDGVKKNAGDKVTMPAKALTITAQWKDKVQPEPEKYAVTYAAGGGSGNAPAVEQVAVGTEITLKANMFIAPSGKEFDGWMVDGVKKAAGDKVTMPAKALTITAQWKDAAPPEPAAPVITARANISIPYVTDTLTGWLVLRANGSGNVTIRAKADNAVVLNEDIGYTIDDEGVITITNTGDDKIKAPATGSIVGRTVIIEIETTDDEPATYKFQSAVYKLTVDFGYDMEGGRTVEQYIPAGLTNDFTDVERDGYRIKSIKVGDAVITDLDAVKELAMIAEDVTVVYTWEEDVVTVTFKNGENTVKTVTIRTGAALTADDMPEAPTVGDDKAFLGWFNGTTEIKVGVAIDEDVVATAKIVDLVTVTFKNGETTVKTVKVRPGAALTADDMPEAPTVDDDHEFQGWFNGTTEIKVGATIDEDVVATAKIVDVYNYTINYYAPQWPADVDVYLYVYNDEAPVADFDYNTTTLTAVADKTGWYTKSFKVYAELEDIDGIIFHGVGDSMKHEIKNLTGKLAIVTYFNDSSDVIYDTETAAQEAYVSTIERTVNFYAPAWTEGADVYLYVYADNNPLVGHWGTPNEFPTMEAVDGHDNWYSYTFSFKASTEELGFIFMTEDTTTIKHEIKEIAATTTALYFVSNSKTAVYESYEAGEEGYEQNAIIPPTEYTFYYYAPTWTASKTLYIYTYGGLTLGADDYHGNTMTAVDGKDDWYSMTYATKDVFTGFNVIFHDYNGATVKHTIVGLEVTGTEFYFVENGSDVYASYEAAEAGYTVNQTPVELTIYFYAPNIADAKIHMWDNHSTGDWGSTSMTKEIVDGEATGWFTYTFTLAKSEIATKGQKIICFNGADGMDSQRISFEGGDYPKGITDPNALYFNLSKGAQQFTSKEAALA